MGRPWNRVAYYKTVIVNTKTEKAFRGVLVGQTGSVLRLRQASLLEAGSPAPVPLDGDVLIDVENVDFVQTVSTSEA